MKKIFLSLALVGLFSAVSYAQISQGTILVGASSNLGYNSTSFDGADDNLNIFNIEVKGGYFIIDNLALGLGLGYASASFGDESESATAFGIFGRYYINGKFFLGAGYQSEKSEGSDALGSVPLEVGYAAFITDNIAVEPALGYSLGMGDNESSTFGLNVGFTLYLNRN